ncbi:DUF3048 domain-containing protein [Cohnella nanjingensis]|uniref:DUF3048 domain-containing protein n=1 Tax=Cohnella nanjingensis TaxID=1387779 RepID=A0A7X0RMA7_9BACL|nr:DUF3048 domain-containing protein [Cohnella nanjingensis]MBB6670154.1 DUF3048 domain-containing protein [Cohnella nanjingensis]
MNVLHSRYTRRVALALTVAAGLAVLSGCGGAKPTVAPEPTTSASTEPTATDSASEAPDAAFLAPLTGLPVEEEVSKRPLAIMINNFKAARPQSGLTQADTVWEILAEGGITRLVGIFQSKSFDEPVGPIRSIRPYLIDIGEWYGGVLVHAGASNDALALLQHSGKADLDEINNAGAYFHRDKSRKAPHNLYSTIAKLREGAAKHKYAETAPVPFVSFDSKPNVAAEPAATDIEIMFQMSDYKVSYHFDASTGLYERSINGQPHIDLNNKEQLTAANLVVLSAKHKTYDSYGRLEIDLTSGGEAVLFQEGHAISCTWERKKGDIVRLMKDGAELKFVPGITYYHVVPTTPAFSEHVKYQ